MKKNLLAASLALALGTMAGTASAKLVVNEGGIGHLNIVPYYSVQDGNNTLLTITNTDTTNGKIVKVRFRAAEWSDDALDFQVFLSPADVWTAAFGMVDGQLKLVTADNSCTLPLNISGQTFATTRVEGNEIDRLKEGYVEIFDVADIRPLAVVDAAYNNNTQNVANPLFTATKHINGVAPCAANAQLLENLVEDSTRALGQTLWQAQGGLGAGQSISFHADNMQLSAEVARPEWQRSWMAPPTGGLATSATVIAVGESKAFTVPAVAITSDNVVTGAGAVTLANRDYAVVQYFRQANAPISTTPEPSITSVPTYPSAVAAVNLGDLTADRLFWPVGWDTTVSVDNRTNQQGADYTIYQFDLPDVSTPFWNPASVTAHTVDATNGVSIAAATTLESDHLAEIWRDQIASLLRKSVVISEYEISSSVGASTDIVLSQPVRRYYYSYQPITSTTAVFGTHYNRTINSSDTTVATNKWRVDGLTGTTYEPMEIGNTIVIGGVDDPKFYDREEQTLVSSNDVVPSPQEPGVVAAIRLKGETSVVSIKHGEGVTGALGARLTAVDWTFSPSYTSGWVRIAPTVSASGILGGVGAANTPDNTFLRGDLRLPVVGFTAINVFNASAGANGTNYGMGLPLRYIK